MTRLVVLLIGVSLLNGPQLRAAPLDALSKDEAAIASHFKALHDVQSEVRAAAAEALRTIVAKYRSPSVNIRDKDGGEARWVVKINRIEMGMKKAEVLKIIPSLAGSRDGFHSAEGQSHTDRYRLDLHWMVQILYANPGQIRERPELIKSEMIIHVTPPENYTGTWISWHINGQKGDEAHYRNGKYHGVHATFYDNGQTFYDQHYTNGVADGAGTGWYRDGEKSYVIHYQNGKHEGGTHWYASGQKRSEGKYKNGLAEGSHIGWYENGRIRSVRTYKNGVRHGPEACWDEGGVLEYKREYRNGNLVDPAGPAAIRTNRPAMNQLANRDLIVSTRFSTSPARR